MTPEHTDFDFSSDVSLLPVLTRLSKSEEENAASNGCRSNKIVEDDETLGGTLPEMNSTELGPSSPVNDVNRYPVVRKANGQ
jgi:hypothetical protein